MKVALLPGTRDWSYDFTAKALIQHLSDRFEFVVFYSDQLDELRPLDLGLDLVVDFWWKGEADRRFSRRVVKQVSSHRWARNKYGGQSAQLVIANHLRSAGGIVVPSKRLATELAAVPHLTVCPKGFHPETFGDEQQRNGGLVVGWVGNAGARDKRADVIRAACRELRAVGPGTPLGKLDHAFMPAIYNSFDVITCASDAEGDPRPLIEGMACGCFPVTVDVGIVPELVRHGENGLIVERTPEAFAAALAWCRANVDQVREAGRRNAIEMLATRTWKQCAVTWGDAIAAAIERAPAWKINRYEDALARHEARRRRRERRASL